MRYKIIPWYPEWCGIGLRGGYMCIDKWHLYLGYFEIVKYRSDEERVERVRKLNNEQHNQAH